ncbi:hypothetical protein BSKO_14032 [Bryopsis sp. KO-2023]|nr:hypothetical protein BSKO_14032 [Bryopsis sp. KO-2023]
MAGDTQGFLETVAVDANVKNAEGQISTDEASGRGQEVSKLGGARSQSLDAARPREKLSIQRASEGGTSHTSFKHIATEIDKTGGGAGVDQEGEEDVDGNDIDASAGYVGKEGLADEQPAVFSHAKKESKRSGKKKEREARQLDLTAASMQESFSAPCPADLRRLKRMPPLPKFKVKQIQEDEQDPDWVSVQYRVRTALTVDDVEYVRANDEYNQAIYLQWKRNKGRELREQAEMAKKEEQRLATRLDRLDLDNVKLNKARFQSWLEGKKQQHKQEHQHHWDTFQAYSKSIAVMQAREIHEQGHLALRESCFKLSGAKLPKTFDDWDSR